jgi:hypothetical protein
MAREFATVVVQIMEDTAAASALVALRIAIGATTLLKAVLTTLLPARKVLRVAPAIEGTPAR